MIDELCHGLPLIGKELATAMESRRVDGSWRCTARLSHSAKAPNTSQSVYQDWIGHEEPARHPAQYFRYKNMSSQQQTQGSRSDTTKVWRGRLSEVSVKQETTDRQRFESEDRVNAPDVEHSRLMKHA